MRNGRILSALVAAALLAGCSQQRPLYIVERDGDHAYRAEDYSAAALQYEEYVARKPEDAPLRYKLGETYLKLNEPGKAREQLNVACDIDPGNDQYADTFARSLYEAGEKENVMSYVQRLAGDRGRSADYIRLGYYAALTGSHDEAEQALKRAAQIDHGTTIAPQLALADFYKMVGDKQKELTRLRMALFIEPGNAKIHHRIRDLGQIPGPSYSVVPEER